MNRVENSKEIMKKIHFEDNGQGLLWFVIDENGIVIDCNTQKDIWNGTQLLLDKLHVGRKIFNAYSDDDTDFTVILEIVRIEPLKKQGRP